VAGRLRLDLAQYREMAAFAQFGTELDKATQAQLARGERMVEVLKQGQYQPLPVENQIMIIYAGTAGQLDDLPIEAIQPFEEELYRFVQIQYPSVLQELREKKVISDELRAKMDQAITECKAGFLKKAKAA